MAVVYAGQTENSPLPNWLDPVGDSFFLRSCADNGPKDFELCRTLMHCLYAVAGTLSGAGCLESEVWGA